MSAPPGGQGLRHLAQQQLLCENIPVVQDPSHDQDIRSRQVVAKKVARMER
jgi:hypothetical protein